MFLIGLLVGAGLATLVCYGLWYKDKEEDNINYGGADKDVEKPDKNIEVK